MKPADRIDLVRKLDLLEGGRAQMLVDLGIPRSTFYHWRSEYDQKKEAAFIKTPSQRRVWNKLESNETERVLDIALGNPELSPRLLAIKITDEESFSVSESTVYRILKQRGLIYSRPLPEMPAAKEWKKKTTRPDELWQCDGTNLFIVGWGYYKLIPVEDDYSRKILGFDLKPDESGFSISDVMEIAIEEARKEGHVLDPMPTLYTDNGPGFASDILTGYLAQHGIRHIFGTPYHPQGRGKIERFNRSIKVHFPVMQSWAHSLVYVRNVCAHHSRLWNKELAIRPFIPHKIKEWRQPFIVGNARIFSIILIIHYCLRQVKSDYDLKGQIKRLIQVYPVNIAAMGMASNWEEHAIFKEYK